MELVTYETPDITDNGNLKPVPFEMASFPYNQLSNDRRFEELVYSLYKSEIEENHFGGYTAISLMNGVRDRGSDCCLTINGKTHGLIQCKKYAENYGKEAFGVEITKFVLYYLLDNRLIADLNNFTYYIAVSKGFVSTCLNFIKDFNINIRTDTHLDGWIDENLKSATILELGLGDIKEQVLNVLTQINVKTIIPQDLDILLTKHYNSGLVKLFFAIRTQTDNTLLEKGLQEIKALYHKTLSAAQLVQELKTGSFTISNQSNTIGEIPDSHIERAETIALYNWVTISCEVAGYFKNICLLAGGAGYGKTVITKDLYDKLKTNNIPTLALKADKLYVNNFKELQEKINISVPIHEFIDQCKQHFETIVIIIDQIDALSQSLSSNRSFLDTYVSLIEGYKNDPIVRIIISVRYFDLLYDPALRPYKDVKTIEVKLLAVEDVKRQLAKIGHFDKSISTQLMELLRIPNNLDVFSRIYQTGGDFAGINSIQGLYSELWKIKITNVKEVHMLETERIKETLFLIAAEMYRHQKISVKEASFETFATELKYLKSEQIINSQRGELQFFHQSFYDYVFARQFVETRSSVLSYIHQENQSILARAALKMILNYLREIDPQSYDRQVSVLLKNKKIRFHVHHLIITTVAVIDKPSIAEKKLLQSVIKRDKMFFITFCEQSSLNWINYFIQSGLIDEMLFPRQLPTLVKQFHKITKCFRFFKNKSADILSAKPLQNLALVMLQRNIAGAPAVVLPYLKKIENKEIVLNILFHLSDWTTPGALAILESCGSLRFDDYRHSKILEDLVSVKPEYVFEKIKDWLVDGDSSTTNDLHRKEGLLKKLFEFLPEPTFQFLFQYFIRLIDGQNYHNENKPLIQDYIIYDINFDEEHLHGNSFVFQQLLGYLKDSAETNQEFFMAFLEQNIKSQYLAVQRAIIYVYSGREKQYRDYVFQTFRFLNSIDALNAFDVLSDSLRLLLQVSFPFFKKEQSRQVIQAIENIPVKDYYIVDRDGKKSLWSRFGLNKYRYLMCLPPNLIANSRQLNKEFGEYQRKYPDRSILESNKSRGGLVRAPLTDQAYSKMNYNAWIRSFKKFNVERGINAWGEDFLKGGLSEHAAAFKTTVKKNPEKYLPLLDYLFQNLSISIEYHLNGLEALSESDYDKFKVLEFFKVLIAQNLTGYAILGSIRIANYLVRHDVYDPAVMDYLFNKALNDPDPVPKEDAQQSKNDHLIGAGINSVRGSAVYALTFAQSKDYEDRVFQTLTKIARRDTPAVVAAMLYKLAYLMNLNRDKAFSLFLSILNNESHTWLIESAWSLSYLIHYDFQLYIPYLNRVFECDLNDSAAESFGNILFGAYYNNYANAKELLDAFITKFAKTRTRTIRNAIEFIHMNESSFPKSISLLEQFVTANDKDTAGAFHVGFLHMDHITFEEFYPFLKKYAHTDAICESEYFLTYLLSHCHSFPEECLHLFEFVVHHVNLASTEDIQQHHYNYEENAVNLIIGIYNSLRPEQHTMYKQDQEKLLTLFDATLRDSRFKSNTDKLLEKIIY